jgi:predicted transcriptional regulator
MAEEKNDSLRDRVAEVSAAYFANSHVGVSEIGAVIAQIAQSLGAVGGAPAEPVASETESSAGRKLTLAQIRKSITPDVLMSFEDGRPYKTLRRHLAVRGLTPEQYREKWGLPSDYPMVSPNYSETRSRMAKQLGLGGRVGVGAPPPPAARRRRSTKAPENQ